MQSPLQQTYSEWIVAKNQIMVQRDGLFDAHFTKGFGTQQISVHWIVLPPNERSSLPHAESTEEEFVYIKSGRPHLWLNGWLYQLEPGHLVGFPAGTGITHCLINNTSENVDLIVVGEVSKPGNQFFYPLHPELKSSHQKYWWENPPEQELGPHDAKIGNLNHQKDWRSETCIQLAAELKRNPAFTYKDDTELFTSGIHFSQAVGLKTVAIWLDRIGPGQRSSIPHAHSVEEEFAMVMEGQGSVWLNGFIHSLPSENAVYFKPGSSIAHTIINDSNEDLDVLVVGLSVGPEGGDQVRYPLNSYLNEVFQKRGWYWENSPMAQFFGAHPGVPLVQNLQIKEFVSARGFLAEAESWLLAKEFQNFGIHERALSASANADSSSTFFLLEQRGKIVGVACLDKTTTLMLSAMSEPFVKEFAEYLGQKVRELRRVRGPVFPVQAFVKYWQEIKPQSNLEVIFFQSVFELEALKIPEGVDGKMVVASEQMQEILREWYYQFAVEAFPGETINQNEMLLRCDEAIKSGKLFVWLNELGAPVSMCSANRSTQNGVMIGSVYTPATERGKGYASALTAHVSQSEINSGKKFIKLFTDSLKPTPNKIYKDIGFVEKSAERIYVFRAKS